MQPTTLEAPQPDVATPPGTQHWSLIVPPDVRLRIDAEDFAGLCALNRGLRLELAADGGLTVMAPVSSDSGGQEAELLIQLGIWNRAKQLGKVFSPSSGFTFPNGAIRAPDASWIRRERWEALDPRERKRFSHIAPDFVAEIRSPSDGLPDLQAKMAEYIDQGVRLGWLIDPTTQTVEIHRPGRPPERLEKPNALSGEDVLPDFTLELAEILYD
ncbi:Uma2 family endonuclease [Paludisphaera rhizosphaerae]|uniref:Uma2 family endonuclease n=1 Tax=Paludisphaera rhizosphaerae TaxID=2711216 RepID=UPI0013E9AB62|nr:Uma2 family endonuclease [Paludisphaera rhizosphaerae]